MIRFKSNELSWDGFLVPGIHGSIVRDIHCAPQYSFTGLTKMRNCWNCWNHHRTAKWKGRCDSLCFYRSSIHSSYRGLVQTCTTQNQVAQPHWCKAIFFAESEDGHLCNPKNFLPHSFNQFALQNSLSNCDCWGTVVLVEGIRSHILIFTFSNYSLIGGLKKFVICFYCYSPISSVQWTLEKIGWRIVGWTPQAVGCVLHH